MESWSQLALRARSGDRRDLEQFVNLTYGPTRRLCAALVDEASADDLAQETFLRVAKSIRRYRGESSAKTWLFSIAHHVCASELRSRIRHRRHAGSAGDTEPTRHVDTARTDEVVVDDLLRRLDPDRRAAFTLTQLYGLSYAETADVCHCAPGTVASRVARARDDLMRMVSASDGTGRIRTDRMPPVLDDMEGI